MASEYCRQILRVVVAQICQHLGWHSTHATPLEVLTDVLERYILDVSRTTHQYAERYGRTEVNLDDLGLAFRTLGISLSELDDYIKHVEALPFGKDVAAFPKPKKSNLCFPNPKSREIYHREEHVPDYLPYMFPGMEDEMEVEEVSPTPSVPAASQPGSTTPVTVPNNQEIGTPENLADTSPVLRGEKRSLNSPSDGAPIYKRQRLSNNNLPEEAGHSQYEMTSVKMSVSGLLTPIKSQGKLPDPSPPVMFPPVEKKKELPPKDIPKKTEPEKDTNTSKIEDKENITTKKPKENDISKKNIPVKSSGKIVSKSSASSTSGKPLKKNSIVKAKITKIVKKGNIKGAVSVKTAKSKVISKSTSKVPAVKAQVMKSTTKPSSLENVKASSDASGPESRLKELLLDSKVEKTKETKIEKKMETPSPLSKKPVEIEVKPWSNLAMSVNPGMLPKNLNLVPDNDSSSSDESPEPRLVIAESDPKPKEKKSSEIIREQTSKYDSIISSAIKRAGMMNSKSKELTPVLPPPLPPPPPKERKKPVARKKKKEQIAKVEKSTLETIDECINSVLRNMRAAYELEKQKEKQEAIARNTIAEDAMVAATTAAVVSAAVTDTVVISSIFTPTKPSLASTPTPKKTDKKGDKKLDKKLEKKKRNLMKEKTKKLKIKALKQKGKENAEVREKLKEKIKSKSQRPNSSSSEKTPPVRPDGFTAEEWKIYDFDGSPPGSHSNSLHQHDSSPFSSSPHSIRSCVSPSMDSLTLLSTAASAASNVPMHLPPSMPLSLPQASLSSQDSDIPSQLKMKIGLAKGGKGKIKSKVKSKDKEHKKDKKDKKKDKEKKKKNKEKEEKKQKERLKEEKYQCVVVSQAEQISTPLSVPRLKLNIKLGGSIPVAVTPDTDTSKKIPTSAISVTERAPSNTPTNIKRDIPSSPLPHRPEIPRLVIRTPVPVMSPPVVPAKNEKSTAKVTKPTPKAKAALKKKPVVKKPAVKREKPTPKKSSKVIAPEPVNVPSICKIEALNAPPQIPQFLPTVSASKHSEIGNVNIADMLMPEALLAVVKQDKFSPPKPLIKSQKMTAAAREKLTQKEKQMLLKTQTLPVSTAFGLRKAEEKSSLKTSKVNQNKTKAAKATKTTAKLTGKNEKVCIRGKSEKATAKAKAEKIKAEKAALEMAATALAKVEKPVIMKDRPIMKVNKPPNKLGRPPKIEIPPSPPPTIPYPSSPPCIPASIGGTLPIAQPIGHHHFTPLLANIPTPVPTIPQPYPITVSTPKANQVVPKVAVTAKTTPKGRGARAHAISLPKAQRLTSAKALLASVKGAQSDSHVTCPSNLLTPMPLTSSPALSEKLMIPNKSSPIPSPLSSPLHMISGLPPDNSLIALSRDIVSADIPMDSSASFSLPISDIIGCSENSMSLGKRPVQRSVFAETVGTFMDESGQKIWICPGCKLPDDGSPMIGCDGCDDWYHWPCVNIREEPPSEEQWFCQKCLVKTKNKPKRKRRRKAKAY